jgi:malic enzyme
VSTANSHRCLDIEARGGTIAIAARFPIADPAELVRAYTPGAIRSCQAFADAAERTTELTAVAIVSDGRARRG